MLVLFARVPISQARKLKCLTDFEVETIQQLYTVEYPSVWLGWACGKGSNPDRSSTAVGMNSAADGYSDRLADPAPLATTSSLWSGEIPSPDCIITTQSQPGVIRRVTADTGDPDVPSLHRLMDILQPVIYASSCLQSLWFVGEQDIESIQCATQLYGACLRLTLGLGAALTLVGIQTEQEYTTARVWCDMLQCNLQLVTTETDAAYWSKFQSTLLWTGPLAIKNVSLLPKPLHLFNFRLIMSDGGDHHDTPLASATTQLGDMSVSAGGTPDTTGICTKAATMTLRETGAASEDQNQQVDAASSAAASVDTGMQWSAAASVDTGMQWSAGKECNQSTTPSLLPRSNSGAFTRQNSLESWILSCARHCYLDVQWYLNKQAVLHCPVEQQSVSVLTCCNGRRSSSRNFLDRLSLGPHVIPHSKMCLLAQLSQYSTDTTLDSFREAARHQNSFIEWVAENPPDAIGKLRRTFPSAPDPPPDNPSPVILLLPRAKTCARCLRCKPVTSTTSGVSSGSSASSKQQRQDHQQTCSGSGLYGWLMISPAQLTPNLHSMADRIHHYTLSQHWPDSRVMLRSKLPADSDTEDDSPPDIDDIIGDLAVFDARTSAFTSRVERKHLLEKGAVVRTKLSTAFARLLFPEETPEMQYLKHRQRAKSPSTSSMVTTTPTGRSVLDPPIFSDSVKVGKYHVDPAATVSVKRLINSFCADGSAASTTSLQMLNLEARPKVVYNHAAEDADTSHTACDERLLHGVEYCRDGNDGLASDLRLHKLRDSLSRLIDPTSSAVEFQLALSDDVDMLPTPTSHGRTRGQSARSSTDDRHQSTLSRLDRVTQSQSMARSRSKSTSLVRQPSRSSMERLASESSRTDRQSSSQRHRRASSAGARDRSVSSSGSVKLLRRQESLSPAALRRHKALESKRRATSVSSSGVSPHAPPSSSSRAGSSQHSRLDSPSAGAGLLARSASNTSLSSTAPAATAMTSSHMSPLQSMTSSPSSLHTAMDDGEGGDGGDGGDGDGGDGGGGDGGVALVATAGPARQHAASSSSLASATSSTSSTGSSNGSSTSSATLSSADKKARVKRSDRHKQQLQLIVEHVVAKYGIERSDPLFQKCSARLFKVCKIFLEDLTTSHNLVAEMKKVAKNNVKQVIQSECKNANRPLPE